MTIFKRIAIGHAFLLAVLFAVASSASASELYALGGAMHSLSPSDTSYSWQIEYRQDILKHLAGGISYLNEGHIRGHHRDGYSPQLWVRSELLAYRLTVAAAAGPYFFLDTVNNPLTARGFTNDHGLKAMVSLALAYHLQDDLIFEVRSNWVAGDQGFNTLSVLGGIGYHFDPDLEPVDAMKDHRDGANNEITVFGGRTIVNSFRSQESLAIGVEYRRRLLRHLEWTIGGIHEGDTRLSRRDGLVTQIWPNQDLLEGLFSVGAGIGPYLDVSHHDNALNGDDDRRVACLLTLSGAWRMTPHWSLRLSWNRLVTSNDRDTDIIMGGLGFRF